MEKLNPVFEKNYKGYLEALTDLDLSIRYYCSEYLLLHNSIYLKLKTICSPI